MGKFKKVIELILILVVIFCFSKVGLKYLEYESAKATYKELEEIENEIDSEKNISTILKLEKKYNKMKDINSDYVFWLDIPGTNINYPVVKSLDNYDYLHKNFKQDKNSSGTIFLDYTNRMDDFNSIIHGHNMKNGTMFNNLVKFKEKEFFEKNKEIKISYRDKEVVYEVFAVYAVKSEEDFLRRKYSKEYIDFINSKSLYKTNKKITDKDKIITLSTCSYEFEDARTVVHAVEKTE